MSGAEQARSCPKCQAAVRSDARFCRGCGEHLPAEVPPAAPPVQVEAPQAEEWSPPAPGRSEPAPPSPVRPTTPIPTNAPSRNAPLRAAALVAGTLAILGAGASLAVLDTAESLSQSITETTVTDDGTTSSYTWDDTAEDPDYAFGETYYLECGSNGAPGQVWGVRVYTGDSSICTAAVHAGLIDFENGGVVTFKIVRGRNAYRGSRANGVTSEPYGAWERAFRFVR